MTNKTTPQPIFKRILVAIDGSENSFSAARVAISLAKKHEAELLIVNALYTPTYWVSYSPTGVPPAYLVELREDEERKAEPLVAKVKGMASAEGLDARTEILKSVSSVVEAITLYASDQKVDLIVIGTRGLSGFKKLLIGSVSSGVVTHAHCSVLVVR
jgi:nucleotide-binding universal stress UspA family protein